MTMQELGELFTAARQEAGLSLEDVHDRTRISLYVLEALESGETAKLPHPVYTKGFIRNYAKLLGLEHEKIVREYLALMGPADSLAIDTDIPELNVPRKLVKEKRSKYSLFLRIAFVLVIAAWLSFAYIFNDSKPVDLFVPGEDAANVTDRVVPGASMRNRVSETEDMTGKDVRSCEEHSNATNSTINEADTPTANTEAETGNKVQKQSLEQLSDGAAQDAVTSAAQHPKTVATSKASHTNKMSNSDEKISSAQPASNDKPKMRKHRLRIETTHKCWFKSIADKDVNPMEGEALLKPGQVKRLSFDGDMYLTLGNGGGVRLFVDGKPYPFKGALNEVKTLVISVPGE